MSGRESTVNLLPNEKKTMCPGTCLQTTNWSLSELISGFAECTTNTLLPPTLRVTGGRVG